MDGCYLFVVPWTVPEEFHYDSTYLNRVHVSLATLIASHINGPFFQKQFGNSIKTFMTPQFDIFAISCQLQTIYIIMHLTSNNIVCLVRISQIFWDFCESEKLTHIIWAILYGPYTWESSIPVRDSRRLFLKVKRPSDCTGPLLTIIYCWIYTV